MAMLRSDDTTVVSDNSSLSSGRTIFSNSEQQLETNTQARDECSRLLLDLTEELPPFFEEQTNTLDSGGGPQFSSMKLTTPATLNEQQRLRPELLKQSSSHALFASSRKAQQKEPAAKISLSKRNLQNSDLSVDDIVSSFGATKDRGNSFKRQSSKMAAHDQDSSGTTRSATSPLVKASTMPYLGSRRFFFFHNNSSSDNDSKTSLKKRSLTGV